LNYSDIRNTIGFIEWNITLMLGDNCKIYTLNNKELDKNIFPRVHFYNNVQKKR